MNSTNTNNLTINLAQALSGVVSRLNCPTDFTEAHSCADVQLNHPALLGDDSEVSDAEFFALHPQPTLQESRAFLEQDAMLRRYSVDQPDGNSENGEDEDEEYHCGNADDVDEWSERERLRQQINVRDAPVLEDEEEEDEDTCYICYNVNYCVCVRDAIPMDVVDEEEEKEGEEEDMNYEHKRQGTCEQFTQNKHQKTHQEHEREEEEEEEDIEIGAFGSYICSHGTNCKTDICEECVWCLEQEGKNAFLRERVSDDIILKLCSACIESSSSSENYEGIMPSLLRQKAVSSDDWLNGKIQPLDANESAMFRCWHRVDYTKECDKCRQVLLALPPLTRLKAFHGDANDIVFGFGGAETEEFVINVVLEDDVAEKRPTEKYDEPIDPDDLVHDPSLSVEENQYRRNMRDLEDLYAYHPWSLSQASELKEKLLAYELANKK